jgi:hypothetical protein
LAALTVLLAGLAAAQVAMALLVRGFAGWCKADSAAVPNRSAEPALPTAAESLDVIFVKTEQRLEKVRLDEILVIEGQRDYRRIHTPTRRIMTLQTFAEFRSTQSSAGGSRFTATRFRSRRRTGSASTRSSASADERQCRCGSSMRSLGCLAPWREISWLLGSLA